MSVKKPIGLGLLIGLLALAFAAVPAMAQPENVTLRNVETGEALALEAPVNAESTNTVTTTAAGTLECNTVELEGEVTRNGEPELATVGNVNGSAKGGGEVPGSCASNNEELEGVTVTVNVVHPVHFFQNGQLATYARFTSVLHHKTLGNLTCVFEGVVLGSFKFNVALEGENKVHVGPSKLTASGETCPVEEGTLEGDFTVTSGGEAVKVTKP